MDDIEIKSASFPEYEELDDLLKCGICYETITTPVITSCSHTFCSICIRKWLTTKQICPSCAEVVYESSLRKNPIVGNIVEALKHLKKKKNVQKEIKSSSSSTTLKRSSNFQNENSYESKPKYNHPVGSSRVKTFNSPSNSGSSKNEDGGDFKPKLSILKTPPPSQNGDSYKSKPKSCIKVTSPSTPTEKSSASQQLVSQTTTAVAYTPTSVRVQCPVCQAEMPERLVYDHLDRCLAGGSTRLSESKNASSSKTASTSSPSCISSVKKNVQESSASLDNNNQSLEPIKKMVYNLLSDKQLKLELKKYGLSTQGDRRTLRDRLQRFVIMHNAECDSDNPRPVVVIKQQLEREEKAMAAASTTTTFSQMFKKSNNPDEIETVNKEYIRQNKSSYQVLINQIKNRDKGKPKKKVEPEDEDDPSAIESETTSCPESSSKAQGDSDSDCVLLTKTPRNTRRASKNFKRKVRCIESESENEDDSDSEMIVRQEKKAKEATSPVLACKTPVRRELRSHSQNKTTSQQREPVLPRTRNQRKFKTDAEQKKELKQAREGHEEVEASSPVCLDDPVKVDASNDLDQERFLSPTPDLFGSPSSPASSGEIICGQKRRKEESGNDALDELVSMIDNGSGSGSATDFED